MSDNPVEFIAALAAAQKVADQLSGFTYRWLSEMDLQAGIGGALDGFDAEAEVPLTVRDRPDFTVMVDGLKVVIEVKVRGARNAVLRQLGRYAEHPTVAAVVLASGRRTLVAGMPGGLHGKPLAAVMLRGRV